METLSYKTAEKPKDEIACASGCCNDVLENSENPKNFNWGLYVPTFISLVLLFSGLALDYYEASWFADARLIWYVVAYLPVGLKVLWYATKNIAKGQVFNEFFLMGMATLGAFFIGEYAEAVAVMLFYVIGEHFQEAAVKKSRKSIKDLIDNRPEMVQVFRNGSFVAVSPDTVGIGETVQLKAGEKAALDGVLLSKKSSFNTAALTGESRPDTKRKGEKVLAGMLNLDRVVEVSISERYENSALSKILHLVEEAISRKAKPQKFITRFAKVYTPIVFFGAVALSVLPYFFVENYIFSEWLYQALVFLVVSCPCALVISIPLGYFGGIGAASKNGILFKGANYLDLITKLDSVVFDKTGTLTKGVFEVQQVELAEDTFLKKEEFIALAAALEGQSTHPIAKAVSAYAAGKRNNFLKISETEEISGYGLKGKVEGKEILAGNIRLLEKYGIDFPSELQERETTVVVVSINGKYTGYFDISDEIKEDAKQSIENLRRMGISEIVMLSGDKNPVVQKMAKELAIDRAYGCLLPAEKTAKLEELKTGGKIIAFVGDGINDAPVLALADVGIAMGGLGSDAAIETADVVIQNDQPSKIPVAINIGKKTKQVVWQNIILAFGVKALILSLAVFGIASLWGAVFADVGVALLAILNAVRIQWIDFD